MVIYLSVRNCTSWIGGWLLRRSTFVIDSLMLAMCILFCSCLCSLLKGFRLSCLPCAFCLFLPMHSLLKGFRLSCLPSAFCFVPAYAQFDDALSQALCNLSLAFLVDFTVSDSTAHTFHILANYTPLFVWIERHDHSVHMSFVLQVQQLYTAGIPLLEAYLLPMDNRTRKVQRTSPQEQNGR